MDRRSLLKAGLALGMLPAGLGAGAAPAEAASGAVGVIERFYGALKAAMQRTSDDSVAAKARALTGPVNATFDIPAMTRLALGQHAAKVGGQQAQIAQAFGRFLVATYARQIRRFSGEQFEVFPDSEQRRFGTLVRSRIIETGGGSTKIDYLVGGSGRVIDVYLNSAVSELASRRAEFDSILSSGNAQTLLTSLNERTQRLLAG